VLTLKDQSGYTVLHTAARYRLPGMMAFLIGKKADISETDRSGRTVLMVAARHNAVECTKILLKQRAAVNQQEEYGNSTALMRAALIGSYEIVSLLLQERADCNLQKNDGLTALMWTAECDLAAIPDAVQLDERKQRECDTAELLLQHQADINHEDAKGNTALFQALHNQNLPLARLLMAKRANLETGGRTATQTIEVLKSLEVVQRQ